MIRLQEGIVDEDERPINPHKILRTKVLINPFKDITPRETIQVGAPKLVLLFRKMVFRDFLTLSLPTPSKTDIANYGVFSLANMLLYYLTFHITGLPNF